MPWSGHSARYALADIYAAIARPQDGAALRQHAQPGGADLPGAVAHQHRGPADRPPSRLARRHPAPQGRGGDGGGQAPRRGLHLDPRPRHRLGRCRSRRPYRRAQGGEPAGPAHRPRQPPHGRAVQGAAGAGQPLRGDGVPRRARRQLSRRPGHARRSAPARSTCSPSTCSAWPARRPSTPTRSMPRSTSAYPYRELDRATFDRVVEFVATGGYALKTYERFAKIRLGHGRALAHHPSARRPAIPAECRHHHRDARSSTSASRAIAAPASPGAAAACSARSRSTSSRRCRPATPSSSPA